MDMFRQFFSYDVLFTVIFGSFFIFFIDLYGRTKKIWWLILSLLFTSIFLFHMYKLSDKKTDVNVVNLSAKVLPLLILTLLGVLVYKKKFNIYTFIGLFLIVAGSVMVAG